jgi:hypothetical protein
MHVAVCVSEISDPCESLRWNFFFGMQVAYLDRILQCTQVSRSRLQLVAISCIFIAAKFEEAEEHVPTVNELNEFAQHE